MPPLYLDYNASAPLDPRVFDAMKPWFLEEPGNAGSRTHMYGQRARDAVETARGLVAAVLGAKSEEVIFTSGATESDNLAILGLARHGIETGRRHLISTAIEHKAVLEPLAQLGKLGFEVELAPVTPGGYVDANEIRRRVRPDTLLVSVMHANNETGVLQPVEEVAEILHGTETLFHVDAAQTFGKEVDALRRLRCDLVSISGHKIYGPKGIGALYVRRHAATRAIRPIMFGGGQERGLRPGTLPVALAVGLGAAAEFAGREHSSRLEHASRVKSRFLADLGGSGHHLNGEQSRCQSHVVNVSFDAIDSEAIMLLLQDAIAVSNGSACTSASYTASHVLRAMGLEEDRIAGAVRFSWGAGVAAVPIGPIIAALHCLKLGALRV
ncbi:MAG TPA: cysteine desulfurase DndA [Pirellulales bacterium]|nr:cysteine desulfurase DndA [Pirellulales bacterium]